MKTIKAKNEIQALQHDLNLGVEQGRDPESLLVMTFRKLNALLKNDSKTYYKVVWE